MFYVHNTQYAQVTFQQKHDNYAEERHYAWRK